MSETTSYADFISRYDIGIHLVSERRGIWAVQSLVRDKRTTRSAGSLPSAASAHSLLVVGLTVALRDVTKVQAEKLVRNASIEIAKPRVLITCLDETFGEAMRAKMERRLDETRPLRSGRNFVKELARQISRFDVDWEIDPSNVTCLSLRNWAVKRLPDPKTVSEIPTVLMPTVVGDLT